MSKQFYKHKNTFNFSEKFGTVYFFTNLSIAAY
jgi:hypothetical protein